MLLSVQLSRSSILEGITAFARILETLVPAFSTKSYTTVKLLGGEALFKSWRQNPKECGRCQKKEKRVGVENSTIMSKNW
jgi:hypothetical protein